MARQIIRLFEGLGHEVAVVSRFTSRMSDPDVLPALATTATAEQERVAASLEAWGPALWFTYHLYYRAPDLIGPVSATRLGIPYVAAEASHAPRRLEGLWADAERASMRGLQAAKVLLALTRRDAAGLARCPGISAAISDFPPFLAEIGQPNAMARGHADRVRLVCVAMMRRNKKLHSYQVLAQALARLGSARWELRIIGDGPMRAEVEAAFAGFDDGQIHFAGARSADDVRHELARADIFVWPGVGEAYGMAFLEAQERGLPVVAMNSGGVSSVVAHGVSGLLTPEHDLDAFAQALDTLIADSDLRQTMGEKARTMVLARHGPAVASERLREAIALAVPGAAS